MWGKVGQDEVTPWAKGVIVEVGACADKSEELFGVRSQCGRGALGATLGAIFCCRVCAVQVGLALPLPHSLVPPSRQYRCDFPLVVSNALHPMATTS